MSSHLLKEAMSQGIQVCDVAAIVELKDTILLLEQYPLNQQGLWEVPCGVVLKDESLQQALQRVLMDNLNLFLKKVTKSIIYKDREEEGKKKRIFYFAVEVQDPEELITKKHHGFSWTEVGEAFSHPIQEELREVLDLYIKMKT